MSSSNLVRLAVIAETILGTTPGSGNFDTVRFTSETLSGTPGTTESQQIRTDRLSSGQIITSLELNGDVNFELANESVIESFIESAMLNVWSTQSLQTVNIDIDATAKTITRASGDWNITLDVGDFITLGGFVNTENNTQAQVLEIVSALVIRVQFNEATTPVVDETGSGTTYKRADRISIGTTKKSFSMEKTFTDLTTKALIYKGMLANTMSINVAYGEIVTGTFGFNGTVYDEAEIAADFATFGRTINAPATTTSMNGSIDMPIINSSLSGTLDPVAYCIQSLALSLNNNYQPQNCIGETAPVDYSAGTAQVEFNMSTYLSDDNWIAIANKILQTPFAVGFMLQNSDGWFGFYLPSVQVTSPDPASQGNNQQISLDLSGVAKVGSNGESSLFIYRS